MGSYTPDFTVDERQLWNGLSEGILTERSRHKTKKLQLLKFSGYAWSSNLVRIYIRFYITLDKKKEVQRSIWYCSLITCMYSLTNTFDKFALIIFLIWYLSDGMGLARISKTPFLDPNIGRHDNSLSMHCSISLHGMHEYILVPSTDSDVS